MLINENSKTIIVVFLSALLTGFISLTRPGGLNFTVLEMFITTLLLILAFFSFGSARRKYRERKEGLTEEDELSTSLKYKAGYKAYMASMYMWLFIFFLKNHFPNVETILGGGILLSALIYYIAIFKARRELNA